jgi:hypothetical protein
VITPDAIPDGGNYDETSKYHGCVVHALKTNRDRRRHAKQGNGEETPGYITQTTISIGIDKRTSPARTYRGR